MKQKSIEVHVVESDSPHVRLVIRDFMGAEKEIGFDADTADYLSEKLGQAADLLHAKARFTAPSKLAADGAFLTRDGEC